MNSAEQEMYNLINDYGAKSAVSTVIRALMERAHNMSDLGIKEEVCKALNAANLLKDVQDQITD